MIAELLGIAAIGAGAAYAIDPQFRNDVNTAIASATGAASTSTSQPQSTSTTASNIGAGWQQITADLAQLFQNQQQLQGELSTSSTQPPPVNITYPSNSSGSNSTSAADALLSAYLTYLEGQGQGTGNPTGNPFPTPEQPPPAATTGPAAILSPYITQTPASGSGYTTPGAITKNPSGGATVTGYLFGTMPIGYSVNSAGQTTGFYSPLSLASNLNGGSSGSSSSGSSNSGGSTGYYSPIGSSGGLNNGKISPVQPSNSASGFSVAAAKAAGYTVTPNEFAPGGYVLSSGGQQLNIYGNPIPKYI